MKEGSPEPLGKRGFLSQTCCGRIDPAEEESPGSQRAGALILLLHAELAELGHFLRSHKVSAVGGLSAGWGEEVGRRFWAVAGRAYLG